MTVKQRLETRIFSLHLEVVLDVCLGGLLALLALVLALTAGLFFGFLNLAHVEVAHALAVRLVVRHEQLELCAAGSGFGVCGVALGALFGFVGFASGFFGGGGGGGVVEEGVVEGVFFVGCCLVVCRRCGFLLLRAAVVAASSSVFAFAAGGL